VMIHSRYEMERGTWRNGAGRIEAQT